jgi:mono/diheme cytochrome c family protein
MKHVAQIMIGCLALAAAAAASQPSSSPQQTQPQAAPQKPQSANSAHGEEVFHQNCFRCHQEPEGFSPSISRTIVTHMRVRAGLSDPDVKALLEFLNP